MHSKRFEIEPQVVAYLKDPANDGVPLGIIARRFHMGQHMICRIARDNGLRDFPYHPKHDDIVREIQNPKNAGLSAKELGRKMTGIDMAHIYRAIDMHGLGVLRKNDGGHSKQAGRPRPVSHERIQWDEETADKLKACAERGLSAQQAGEETGISRGTIRRLTKKYGIVFRVDRDTTNIRGGNRRVIEQSVLQLDGIAATLRSQEISLEGISKEDVQEWAAMLNEAMRAIRKFDKLITETANGSS